MANSSFHAAGLRGQGVLVGLSDSGIDTDMAFFRDAQVAVPYNKVMAKEDFDSGVFFRCVF